MTCCISGHQDYKPPGADRWPGIDESGHGLTMRIIHDGPCRPERELGRAASAARAEASGEVAGWRRSTWRRPEPAVRS